MDHPNIAKVLDAGATETGRPFFVMELVKGQPITQFCDQGKMSIEDRLELFGQVCAAVQHAHTKGIIHRDIKPSNVLVSEQDGRPFAKVIDFGISKATASKLTEKTLFTQHQQIIGTPEYMSPEQAQGSLDIDTRTDVYSLGVLLYELLTGSTPFSGTELRSAAYDEIRRIIRDVEPPAPSTRLSQNGDTIAHVAASRQTEPKKLGLVVRGELDWIVMKALEKDRQRRYESASGLGADIARYLGGEAVVAAPVSRAYRLRKFVRRNRGSVSAVGAVAAALIIGVVAFAWQAQIARQQRDLAVAAQHAEAEQRRAAEEQRAAAAAQRDRAVAAEAETMKRALELGQVSKFQSKMLGDIDVTDAGVRLMADIRARYAAALARGGVPESERGERLGAFARELFRANATDTAMEMIDRTILKPAVGAVHIQFADQPAVEASLEQSLADLYRTLSRYGEATPLQEHALATRRRVLGDRHPDTMDSIGFMGRLLQLQGKPSLAEPYFREALDSQRAVLGDDHPATLNSMQYMGRLLQDLGRLEEAEPYLREAMERSRRILGEDNPDTDNSINSMGLLLEAMGRAAEAEPLLKEAMEIARRVKGEDHRDTITAISNYGYLLQRQGKFSEAERYSREAMEKSRRALGEEHWITLNCVNNVAHLLEMQGTDAEAEPLYRECMERGRRTLGEEHPVTLRAVANLGNNLRAQGRLDEAAVYLHDAMETRRRVAGEDSRETLIAINTYGYLLIEQGKPAEAEPYWREAYERGRRTLGEDHPDVLVWTNNLGGLLRSMGKLAEAEPYLRAALSKSQRVQGRDHPGTLTIMRGVASLLQLQDKPAEAESLYREVLESRRRVLGPDHPDTVSSILDLAVVLRVQHKLPESETAYREAIAAYERTRGKDHWLCGATRANLARVLSGLNRFADAEAEMLAAEGILSTAKDAPQDRHARCTEWLVKLYEDWDKAEPGKGHESKAAEWKAKLQKDEKTP